MNIIVICLDTFRADLVGEGEKMAHVATPNLDRLASESVIYKRAFGETQPTLQARRSFFTGMRSFPFRFNFDRRGHWHHAAGWHKIPPEQDTMAEALCARGHFTGMITDTAHMFKPTMNYSRGFCSYEFVRGQEDDPYRGGTPAMVADQIAKHCRAPIDWPKHVRLMRYLNNQRDRRREEDYNAAQVMIKASRWLKDSHENSPFFLWVDAFDPHEPWDPPTEYADRYMPDYKGLDFIWPSLAWENGEPSQEEMNRIAALYFGEVTFVDKWIGHLLNTIDELKLWDDTVVAFTSDHGVKLFDNGGRCGKSARDPRPYNSRIPLFIRHPNGPRGKIVNHFAQAHDLAPTLMKMAGVPFEVDGSDIWPMAVEGTPPVRDHAVIAWGNFSRGRACGYVSVRDDDWNYTVSTGFDDGDPQLYDLRNDPEELTNVVGQHPKVVEMQRKRIEKVLGQPLPGNHNEVCGAASSPFDVCAKNWFKGAVGPPIPD